MGRHESVDELLANIETRSLIRDYKAGITLPELKKKYNIYSTKSLENLIKSLVNPNELDNENTIKQKAKEQATYISKIIQSAASHIKSESSFNDSPSNESTDSNQQTKSTSMNLDENREEYEIQLTLEDNLYNSSNKSEDSSLNFQVKGRLAEAKEELTKLWKIGLSKSYICQRFNIDYPTFEAWRKKIGLDKRPIEVHHSPQVYSRRLQKEIMTLEILKLLYNNLGAMYMNDIMSSLQISEKMAKECIEQSTNINTCRLCFYSNDQEATRSTVQFFHNKSFLIIAYNDKRGLLLKLSEVIITHPTKNTLNHMQLKLIFESLLKNNPYNDYDYVEEDFSIFVKLTQSNSFRAQMSHEIESTLKFYMDSKLEELKESYLVWKQISSSPSRKSISSERKNILDKNISDEMEYGYSSVSIRDVITNLLETYTGSGASIGSLHSILIRNFGYDNFRVRYEIKNLIDEGIIVKVVDNKSRCYVLKKYHKERPLYYPKRFFGRSIVPLRFLEEISSLERGDLSTTQNNQVSRLAGLFLAQDYSVKEPGPGFEVSYDFVAENENERFCVKLELNSQLSQQVIQTFYESLPRGNIGVIITLNNISGVLIELSNNLNVQLWSRDVLLKKLSDRSYEPCITNQLSKIMYGNNRGRYAKVISTEYKTRLQKVQFLDDATYQDVFIGSLRQLPLDSKIAKYWLEYADFIRIVRSISSDEEFVVGMQLPVPVKKNESYNCAVLADPDVISFTPLTKDDLSGLFMFSESHRVRVVSDVSWGGFLYHDTDNHNDTPRDFCRKYVLRCECYYWLDQNEGAPTLCRHLVAVLNEAWLRAEDIGYVTKGAENLRFFCLDAFLLYDFLLEVVKVKSKELCDFILAIFSIKGEEVYKEQDLVSIINLFRQKHNLASKILSSSTTNKLVSTNNSTGNYSFDSKSVNRKTLEILSNIIEKFPQINEIFLRLPQDYVLGCQVTLKEIINKVSDGTRITNDTAINN